MRVNLNIIFSIIVFIATFCTSGAYAATSAQPFSQYGVIQNVQNYSTNPFWNPNSPYNVRFPTPVYAKGPKIDTQECQTTVYNLVSSYCMLYNNCASLELSDVRPAVLLALSKMENGNYAASCGGYLDDIFAQYRANNTHAGPSGQVAFPDVTIPNVNADGATIEFHNPFETARPEWAVDMQERSNELAALQAQTHPVADHIVKAAFPATYADLSFEERIKNEQAGYEPYKDKAAYQQIDIKASVLNKKTQGNNNNGGGGGSNGDPNTHNITLVYEI